MKRIKKLTTILFLSMAFWGFSQEDKTTVLLRADDFGMSHSVNLALQKMVNTGIPFNASVMMTCSWAQEAADILKNAPHVAVGLHLTLTSEFRESRWGPISGKNTVPSLVNDQSYFLHTVKGFLLSNYDLKEVEIELRAQIERAFQMGMDVTYLDHHMGIARSTPEIAAVVEKLAKEYDLVISRYFNETVSDAWATPINEKLKVIHNKLNNLDNNRINMFVFHPGVGNPELSVLSDQNTTLMNDPKTGKSIIGKHRNAELNVFLSETFKKNIEGKKIITYKYLKKNRINDMKRNGIIYESVKDAKEANSSKN